VIIQVRIHIIESDINYLLLGPKAKKLKSDVSGGKGSAIGNGLQAKGKKTVGSDEDDDDDDDEESVSSDDSV
jgi:hypothetical protein